VQQKQHKVEALTPKLLIIKNTSSSKRNIGCTLKAVNYSKPETVSGQ